MFGSTSQLVDFLAGVVICLFHLYFKCITATPTQKQMWVIFVEAHGYFSLLSIYNKQGLAGQERLGCIYPQDGYSGLIYLIKKKEQLDRLLVSGAATARWALSGPFGSIMTKISQLVLTEQIQTGLSVQYNFKGIQGNIAFSYYFSMHVCARSLVYVSVRSSGLLHCGNNLLTHGSL